MKRISHWGLVLGSLGLLLGLPVSMAGAPGSALFEQMKAQYHKDYGLELVADEEVYPVAESNGAITARNAGARNVDMVLYFLRKEFAKYPPELIQASGLKRIVFCRDLKANGNRIAGVAVQANATIYMDSSTEIGDESHRRRTLHHEFFHCIDYAMHGERDIRQPRLGRGGRSGHSVWGGRNGGPGDELGVASRAGLRFELRSESRA